MKLKIHVFTVFVSKNELKIINTNIEKRLDHLIKMKNLIVNKHQGLISTRQ